MSKTILGISAFYHDSAAALIENGEITAAAQEERFTRKKHDEGFPAQAVAYCLEEAGLKAESLDYVAFYEKPLLKFDRLIETYLAYAPRGFRSFSKAIPQWLKTKLHHPREIRKALKKEYKGPILFIEHHMSHAASAFFPSPFEEAAILTLDGVGEWDTTSIAVGEGNSIKMLKTISFPHSVGLLYSAFTYFTGFRVNSGEYKLMGLAPYGKPRFVDLILEKLVDLKADGSFALNMDFFTYPYALTMTGTAFEQLFGIKRRQPEEQLEQVHMDLAASVQIVTEKLVRGLALHALEITGKKKLCLAGGVALNCVANGKIFREKIFDDVWIQPAAGDAGGALGAALFTHYQLLRKERKVQPEDAMQGSLLGPRWTNEVIEDAIIAEGAVHKHLDIESSLLEKIVDHLSEGKVVGWFLGRMEFGPRALGSRSILGDPRSSNMQSRMNLKIKFRESFRPFAPSVLEEDTSDYFEAMDSSPYMLLVAPVETSIRNDLSEEEQTLMADPDLRKRVNVKRSTIPAITHVDYSARVQTVNEERHGRYYRLIKAFKERTGCSVLVNTSFNVRGEPIVNSPKDALRCFLSTGMDVLVMENCILLKTDQPPELIARYKGHEQSFDLD
ncbi:MAG: carbamoyltransferase [Verrucomicrobia bacterium]|nr:carbamoyltransferase [Verrucomicrobiota bacterium]MDA1065143.1 carbamoyltransferase [Verrucomicrobiota bacterium]